MIALAKCQASAMDAVQFENAEDPVPPCDELGTEEVRGWWLCCGCRDALEALAALGEACVRHQGEGGS